MGSLDSSCKCKFVSATGTGDVCLETHRYKHDVWKVTSYGFEEQDGVLKTAIKPPSHGLAAC